VAPAKRPRPSPLLPGSGGAGPLPLPPPWWPGPPGPQQLQQQQPQVMVVCSSCAPRLSGSAAMAGGDVVHDPASPGAPTLAQLPPAGPHSALAPGLSTQPPSLGLQQQHQHQLAAGMMISMGPPALEQQWGASGAPLAPFLQPPAAAAFQQAMLQAWRSGGGPEAMPPGVGVGPGQCQAPPSEQVLQQLPLAGAAAVPPAAAWPWLLPGQAGVQEAGGDASCRVSAGAAPPGEQQAGMGDEAWGSTWCMPGASTALGTLLQKHPQQPPLQQLGVARSSMGAVEWTCMQDMASLRRGVGGPGPAFQPVFAPTGLGTCAAGPPPQLQLQPEGHAVPEGSFPCLSEEELEQDLALMWHLMATDQDPQRG
jgi:hypothetical protein